MDTHTNSENAAASEEDGDIPVDDVSTSANGVLDSIIDSFIDTVAIEVEDIVKWQLNRAINYVIRDLQVKCKYGGNSRTLCNKKDCTACFYKSFASYPKSKYWSEKNEKTAREVFKGSDKKYLFNCKKCKHTFVSSPNSITNNGSWCGFCGSVKLCDEEDCVACYNKSFASHPKSKYWCDANEKTPREVFLHDNNKYLFNCEKCKHIFDACLSNITGGNWCGFCGSVKLCDVEDCVACYNKSFALHPKSKYWSEKNEKTPREIFLNDNNKYLFNCEKCKHIFVSSPNNITKNGNWCGFCGSVKLCDEKDCVACYNKSFASHPKSKYWCDANEKTPREVFKNSDNKYLFNCEKCKHIFDASLGHINGDRWCSFCGDKKLCDKEDCTTCYNKSFASHPKSKYWCEANEKKPREVFLNSNNKYLFKCQECTRDFASALNNVNNGKWCPRCKTKTELKLDNFLTKEGFVLQRQAKFDWCRSKKETRKHLPFDFLIESLNLIIELDGPQHFRQICLKWKSPEDTQESDKYKMAKANENGYTVIRILQEDVWYDRNDWATALLEKIKPYGESTIVFICKGDEYKDYKL